MKKQEVLNKYNISDATLRNYFGANMKPTISIITPVYNEQDSLPLFFKRVSIAIILLQQPQFQLSHPSEEPQPVHRNAPELRLQSTVHK